MKLRLKPYREYRDSGVPWLGVLPSHWDIRRLKHLFSERDVRTRTGEERLLSLRMRTGLVDHLEAGGKPIAASALVGYKCVKPPEIVMNRMRAASGLFAVASSPGLVSPDYAVFQPKANVNPSYYVQLFKSPTMTKVFRMESKGLGTGESGFMRLYTDRFSNIAAPLPPIDEQSAIVRFLAYFERIVLRYIRAKMKVIARLNEQKQVIIHRAVTRGLDPNVRLKASGVEWVGDIPEHWETSRVKREFYCLNHRRIPLSGTQRGAMKVRLYDYYGASGVIDKVKDYLFDDDLLLIAEDGANLVLRNLPLAIIARGKFWVNNHAHILKPKRGNLEYLANLMEVVNYRPWISGAAQPKLTQDRLMSIPIVVPPVAEQIEILAEVDAQTLPLRVIIERTRSEIELLHEYRTRLITDVIMGKFNVTGIELLMVDEIQNLTVMDTEEVLEVGELSETEEPAYADD